MRYTEEFKRDAVSQVRDRGRSVKEVAASLGVCTKSLYDWCRTYGKPQATPEEAKELRRLKAELAQVKEERDILKKAAAYFAKNGG